LDPATPQTGIGTGLAPVTTETATRWGEINSARTFPAVDSLLAATAL
jgi:hypothetical protein